ncbi:MAG: hypothetical protein O6768_08455 [Planctomycetota bacterium]|nr:hypothetical protein [Planctomycetota bacterium]
MQALQRTFEAIGKQLGGLPTTAKLLIGSLMVILALSLFLVAQYAGRPSMLPLPINLNADTRAAALSYLEAAGVPYEQRDNRLMVPADQRYTILAQLTDHAVISGEQINFDSLIKQDSPFLTRDQHRRRWLVAKMNVLSAMISRFRGLERATVVIDQPDRPGFGRSHISPTASVFVEPRSGELTQTQVEAIAELVAGSHAGLKTQDVRVINGKTGRPHQARHEDLLMSTKNLEIKRAVERDVRATIENALDYIAGVRIAVNAMVNTTQVEQRTDSFEDPKVGPLSSGSRTITSSEPVAGGVPGVQTNAGVAIAPGGGRGSQMSDERSDETMQSVFPRDAMHITDPKGYALKINAVIGVPRSYFLSKFQLDQGDPEAVPDDAALQMIVKAETARIRTDVEPLIDTAAFDDATPGTVVVSMITDLGQAPLLVSAGTELPAGGWSGGPVGGNLVKYVGLGGLAVISLAMMFMMVRKAGARAGLPSPAEVAGVPPTLRSDHGDIVGEAEESALALEGVELDDDALRRQQMLDQISDMVNKNPDEAAGLLRRWIRVEA